MTMPDKPMVDNGPAIPDNLPDLLQRAAQALPDSFRREIDRGGHYIAALTPWEQGGVWRRVCFLGPEQGKVLPGALAYVEYTCRQEIEARGWVWTTKSGEGAGRYTARVYVGVKGHADVRHGYAPTPAQALLAALLCAVEANNAD